MKRYRLNDLKFRDGGHVFSDILPGEHICFGGMSFAAPGVRSHTNDGPGGTDIHIHDDDREAFVLFGGKAIMEINGEFFPMLPGDIIVIDPGEDHHLISDSENPSVHLWLHAGPMRHQNQKK